MKIKIEKTIKLLDFLEKDINLTKPKIKKLIIQNKIKINNEICNSTNFNLNISDILEIVDDIKESNKNYNDIFNQIKIVYEDDYLLIINKPSGLIVHKDKFSSTNTLEEWINKNYKINLERSGIVHRLDKYTSGLIIVAKTIECLEKLKHQMLNHNIVRKYKAIVLNNFNLNDYIKIDKPIGHTNDKNLKMTTSNPKHAKEAITILKALKKIGKNHFLIECELITGRTHQIRVHMNYINHPILNDPLYGKKIINDDYNQYLYAYYLSFMHPITFIKKEFKIPLPNEFITKIKELENE